MLVSILEMNSVTPGLPKTSWVLTDRQYQSGRQDFHIVNTPKLMITAIAIRAYTRGDGPAEVGWLINRLLKVDHA